MSQADHTSRDSAETSSGNQVQRKASPPAVRGTSRKEQPKEKSNRDPISIAISIVALVISVVGITLTSPLVIEHYRRPRIVVETFRQTPNKEITSHIFVIWNHGRTTATGIRVRLICLPSDEVQLSDDTIATPKHVDLVIAEDTRLRDLYVDIPRLVSGESVSIFIVSKTGHLAKANTFMDHMLGSVRVQCRVPCVVAVAYDQGTGIVGREIDEIEWAGSFSKGMGIDFGEAPTQGEQ